MWGVAGSWQIAAGVLLHPCCPLTSLSGPVRWPGPPWQNTADYVVKTTETIFSPFWNLGVQAPGLSVCPQFQPH